MRAVADLPGIEGDGDRFRVSGRARAHRFIFRRSLVATGIAGDGAGDAIDVLENALDTPEASAEKDFP
jgi:hypothetical protein